MLIFIFLALCFSYELGIKHPKCIIIRSKISKLPNILLKYWPNSKLKLITNPKDTNRIFNFRCSFVQIIFIRNVYESTHKPSGRADITHSEILLM